MAPHSSEITQLNHLVRLSLKELSVGLNLTHQSTVYTDKEAGVERGLNLACKQSVT